MVFCRKYQGSIFSAIGGAIKTVISAIASVVMAIVGAITSVIVTIAHFIEDIICCRCFGNPSRTTTSTADTGGIF
ncbi:hypothetical protein K503DRAFT_697226 [Rhizopogon vinicolor AM-OR11-026]|uniref:Uncharacterized protein n=1 Tax=Rhizopogon vinicolor AM-OR11-026 TaxID=1314800 RepID=A0A1B7MRS0_9AGAM|nr:hypothetical protein K503DRAFT_697226 [Rhizopogon vinicolor AM-OR11-026]